MSTRPSSGTSPASSYESPGSVTPSAQAAGAMRNHVATPLAWLVLEVVREHLRLFGIVAASVAVLGIGALLLIPRRYTSTTAFVVEAAPTAGLSSAMAIISQLNPNLAGGDSP